MIDTLQSSFRSWLISRQYSSATVRNYLVDIKKYIDFIQAVLPTDLSKPKPETFIFSTNALTKYIDHLSSQNNSARYLASLNLFCQFALDQQLIKHNPLDQIRKQTSQKLPSRNIDTLLTSFKKYLLHRHKTPVTIKNYLSDIQSYLSWIENQPN